MLLCYRLVACMVALATCVLCDCGSGTLPAPPASANKSSIGCPGGTQPCSGSVDVPQILVDGSDPATLGLPISCSLTAGSQTMKFITVPSQSWFGSSPGNGSLQASASTTVSINAINAASVSNRNIGIVTVSASGYSDNSQMQVELDCDVLAGTCKVAFSCDVKTNPLP
jgi:hypothetical protein